MRSRSLPLAQPWPATTVRIVVANPPGSGIDVMGRQIAENGHVLVGIQAELTTARQAYFMRRRMISAGAAQTSTRQTQIFDRSFRAKCAPAQDPTMLPDEMRAPAT